MNAQELFTQKNLVIFGVVCAMLTVAYFAKNGGSTGFPSFCKDCQEDLINAAQAGDQHAQEKLAFAIQGGAYQGQGQGLMGPFALIVGLFVVVFIVSRVGSYGQQYSAPLAGYFESGLRGR